MRKIIYIIVYLLCCNYSFSQKNTFLLHDTTFLHRELKTESYYAVYIDTNKNSNFYNLVTNYKWNKSDSAIYLESIISLKEKITNSLKKYQIKDIFHQWIPAYIYKNKYYVLSPREFCIGQVFQFNDTTVIQYTWQGPDAYKINSFEKIDENTFKLKYTHNYVDSKQNIIQQILKIHIIDKKRGISVFEYCFDNGKNSKYELMVSTDKVKNYPLIVEKYIGDRMLDIDDGSVHPPYSFFDKIDLFKMIKKK